MAGSPQTNPESLLGFLGLLGGPATHLPTVQTDKGRSVPLGASRQRLPLPLTGRGRQRDGRESELDEEIDVLRGKGED